MGTFKIGLKVENIADRSRSAIVKNVLVDTGSEYTWLPEAVLRKVKIAIEKKDVPFVMANGQKITRSLGFALIRVGQAFTVDEVVFAQPGDLQLLGARTLEGLNLVVNSRDKKPRSGFRTGGSAYCAHRLA
jgi:predicted aspartyl protease